ncbi:methyltransferase domain-containing protein [Saccharopolyspora sp. HNM0983]|uniref:Methyltransferase domain-containing protein n=1 Tax=Saccharopolyspora montiporae TaxID=2781240 RepID=A0A929FZD9_9PSEU|nr:methyltransferase domain-containing protein [Saccharopolyspora sp. HNM0983]MBE9374274.1 methyltransferase domain-containing protein [Saccharopolyspora sp. HNM0983]
MRSEAVREVLEAELAAAQQRRGGRWPQALDVGGGSGVWAVPLAAAGCEVTVVDPSADALAILQRRADEAGVAERVHARQADTDALAEHAPDGGADLVLAHGLLEVVDDAAGSLAGMVSAAAPGGAVSLLVTNRFAAVLARALAGRVGESLELFRAPDGRLAEQADPLRRRFDTGSLRELLVGAGVSVELVQGHDVLTELVPGPVLDNDPGAAAALDELERLASQQAPMRDIATRLHALGRVA